MSAAQLRAQEQLERAIAEEAAEKKAQERHAGLERVLRSEIKARMRGETTQQQAQQALRVEMASADRAIRGDVEELAQALGNQLRSATAEVARLRAYVEEQLARAAERI